MKFASKKTALKICLYFVLFCIPIICLVCGIIIQKDWIVISGTMGLLLAFIISIIFEFNERRMQNRQRSMRILVSSNNRISDRNINIQILSSPISAIIVESIPEDNDIKIKGSSDRDSNNSCGAPKDSPSYEKVVRENI